MTTALVPLLEAEIAAAEVVHEPRSVPTNSKRFVCGSCAHPWPCLTSKLLSERREREGKLAATENIRAINDSLIEQIETERRDKARYVQANEHNLRCLSELKLKHEAAEATLARVRELRDQIDRLCDSADFETQGPLSYVLDRLDEALTTPTVVSSDRRCVGLADDQWRGGFHHCPGCSDRLAPPVGHPTQEEN